MTGILSTNIRDNILISHRYQYLCFEVWISPNMEIYNNVWISSRVLLFLMRLSFFVFSFIKNVWILRREGVINLAQIFRKNPIFFWKILLLQKFVFYSKQCQNSLENRLKNTLHQLPADLHNQHSFQKNNQIQQWKNNINIY